MTDRKGLGMEYKDMPVDKLLWNTRMYPGCVSASESAAELGRRLAALRRAKVEGMEELEQKYRKELWLNHGHHGLYGDDGEMQCIECHPYGATDYKRDPLDKVEHATFRARMARAAQIEEGE